MILGVGLAWLFFAILVGILANKYGRSGIGWFLLAVIISPIIAGLLLIVLLLPGKNDTKNENAYQTIFTKKCPLCAELISLDAVKCKHCGSDIRAIEAEALSKEHVFTITCYECQSANDISSATVHNFPICQHCGKNIINLKREKHTALLLKYVNDHSDTINNKVYTKLIHTLEPL